MYSDGWVERSESSDEWKMCELWMNNIEMESLYTVWSGLA